MPAHTHGERLDRLEQIVHIIAEDHISLKDMATDLATEMRRGFDQVAKQFRETDARFRETDARLEKLSRETDARFRETDARMEKLNQEGAERGRALDKRIDQLVSAIGAMIRRQDAGRQ